MNFLVVGLGSMGKRRIRCLKALEEKNVFGFDLREDRAKEANEKYGVATFTDFDAAVKEAKPDALIISVPPAKHGIYIKYALEHSLHCFIEASVVDDGMKELLDMEKKSKTVVAPSSTLYFHPAVQMIKAIIKSGELGKLSNIVYHIGQYLPDWHTYEAVSEYYVSYPPTGGGREIVPFELTWLLDIFGMPKRVAGNFRKTIHIEGAEEIDDTYNFLMDYQNFMATITVDVVSRYMTRRLLINGDNKQLRWDWDLSCIEIYDPETGSWEKREYSMLSSEQGYNANIGENMYIDEIKAFLNAVKSGVPFVNTLKKDYEVLQVLYDIEKSDKESRFIATDKYWSNI